MVRAKSQFARHVLDFMVGAKQTEYLKHDELNSTDARFSMDGASNVTPHVIHLDVKLISCKLV